MLTEAQAAANRAKYGFGAISTSDDCWCRPPTIVDGVCTTCGGQWTTGGVDVIAALGGEG